MTKAEREELRRLWTAGLAAKEMPTPEYDRWLVEFFDSIQPPNLLALLDYVDTLELFAQRVASHWDDKDLDKQAREALAKGKEQR